MEIAAFSNDEEQPKGTAMTPDPNSACANCPHPIHTGLCGYELPYGDGINREGVTLCPCTSYVAPSSEVTAALEATPRTVAAMESYLKAKDENPAPERAKIACEHPGRCQFPSCPCSGIPASTEVVGKDPCVDCRDYEANIRNWIEQLGGDPSATHMSFELEKLINTLAAQTEGQASHDTEFRKWWQRDGKHYDPDTDDVPWFDKREGLAGYTWVAARASQASLAELPELDVMDEERQQAAAEFESEYGPITLYWQESFVAMKAEHKCLERQLRASQAQLAESELALAALRTERDTPETEDFFKGVPLEAAHQRARWGTSHDGGKEPADWFWLVGYLAGKCLASHISGNREKALHHTISTAAALANWHMAIKGKGDMRPGIEPPAPTEDRK